MGRERQALPSSDARPNRVPKTKHIPTGGRVTVDRSPVSSYRKVWTSVTGERGSR